MNHNRNRHSGHMNAYKASVVDGGKPVVIGRTLYFERALPVMKMIKGKRVQVGERIQRVRALKHDETIEE